MKKSIVLGVLSATVLVGTSAQATPLPPVVGSYAGSYDVHSTQTGSNSHSFWLKDFLGGPNARDYWQFDSNGGAYIHDGTTATLTGRIQNNFETNAFFDVDASFTYTQTGGRTPKCEFGAACGDASYQTKSDNYEYFEFDTVTLTGSGDMAGLVLALTLRPVDGLYPPQLGYGANNKNINDFGNSTWFFWNVIQNTNNVNVANSGKGDINMRLSPVPLPATLPLFLVALGGVGLVARRRRRAV